MDLDFSPLVQALDEIDLLQTLSAAISLVGGSFGILFIQAFLDALRSAKPEKTYTERLSEHIAVLSEASRRVDSLLEELQDVASSREAAVQKLEADLTSMQERERELRQTIDDLKNVPLPVAEHFAKLTEPGERRSAWRDYILFGAGVVVSTIVGIVLEIAL